jgi:hypothetical protein
MGPDVQSQERGNGSADTVENMDKANATTIRLDINFFMINFLLN